MIAAIMPCKGRPKQTVHNVQRLLATAGDVEWDLHLVVSGDAELVEQVRGLVPKLTIWTLPLTYWQALMLVTMNIYTPLICNLANDLWACDGWLATAEAEYRHHFGNGAGLLGFAGDGHGPEHSCHFLVGRALLERYGGWPVWYQHNFGDTELCARARADGVYWKSAEATLEHCHVERGLAVDDEVYAAGRATYQRDAALFAERRTQGWPPIS